MYAAALNINTHQSCSDLSKQERWVSADAKSVTVHVLKARRSNQAGD